MRDSYNMYVQADSMPALLAWSASLIMELGVVASILVIQTKKDIKSNALFYVLILILSLFTVFAVSSHVVRNKDSKSIEIEQQIGELKAGIDQNTQKSLYLEELKAQRDILRESLKVKMGNNKQKRGTIEAQIPYFKENNQRANLAKATRDLNVLILSSERDIKALEDKIYDKSNEINDLSKQLYNSKIGADKSQISALKRKLGHTSDEGVSMVLLRLMYVILNIIFSKTFLANLFVYKD